jgi:hypothetical protein
MAGSNRKFTDAGKKIITWQPNEQKDETRTRIEHRIAEEIQGGLMGNSTGAKQMRMQFPQRSIFRNEWRLNNALRTSVIQFKWNKKHMPEVDGPLRTSK